MSFLVRVSGRSLAQDFLRKLGKTLLAMGSSSLLWIGVARLAIAQTNAPKIMTPTRTISLNLPPRDPTTGGGGTIAADVNNDDRKDILLAIDGVVAAYDLSGEKLWAQPTDLLATSKAEAEGLPGRHAPGVQVTDVDGDGTAEVLLLRQDGTLQILNGVDGTIKRNIAIAPPSGAERWEHLVVANFRGEGDLDLLLQATNREGYRLGRYLAAYSLTELLEKTSPQPLWQRDDFFGTAHSGVRVADLDGDGRDEVLGGTLLSPEGEVLVRLPMPSIRQRPHLDSIFVADVRPDIPGLEVVALEEGGAYRIWADAEGISLLLLKIVNSLSGGRLWAANRIFLYNHEGLILETHYNQQEPQNAAIGDFDPDQPGLEIWCRSRYDTDQKPFVFNARGELIATYVLEHVAPEGWTDKGLEVIFTIDWTGNVPQLAVAKERHTSGDVALFNPISGQFLYRLSERADRLYIADVLGDWREELIVLNGDRLHVYQNSQPNPQPNHPSLWEQNAYSRSKETWNYYNP